MRIHTSLSAGIAAVFVVAPVAAAPIPREAPISGRIVALKQGETEVLVPTRQQRPAELHQDLKAGDTLRTNAAGTLAIVFADRTQVRLGRNSTLVVREVRQGVPSSVSLQRGSLWARSPRGASQLSVETPSATAAIRGTEYSIVANEERTTLSVVEGVVDFFNPQGRLEIRGGQSAAAKLGQAPTRIFTVNPNSREQMLYYVSLNDAISYLRPAPLPQRMAGAVVRRIKAVAPAERTPDDWLSFAESGADIEPRASIEEALRRARANPLSDAQEARARLVEANFALNDQAYARALQLFQDAEPDLQGRQKEVARYGVFISKTLVDPANAQGDAPAFNENEPISYVGQAFLAAYLGDFDRARAIAQAGIERFPDESELYAMLAGIGILTGDQEAMADAARKALLVDPNDAFAYRVQTELELNYRGNPKAAIRSAAQAVSLAPAGDDYWSALAESYSVWDRGQKSERAFQAGLAETPNSFILHGNYALTLMQQGRLNEGRKQLARARSIDPDNALVDLAEGFLDLSSGHRAEAFAHGLDASAANPSYSEALLLLAELYYNDGDNQLAIQQLDAADRADPNNPFVALYRAAFAIDGYRADDAVVAAREALRRYRARGGVYASLSQSKGTGSYIAGAFRLLDLSEWARYYGDRAYNPFVSAALFDRAISATANPFLFQHTFQTVDAESAGTSAAISDVLQGIRLDPLTVASSEKDLQLTRQRFVELTMAPSLMASGKDVTLSQSAGVNSVQFDPFPVAINISASRSRLDLPIGTNNIRRGESVQSLVGLEPSPYDNIALDVGYSNQRTGLTGTVDAPRNNGTVRDRSVTAYGIYSHQFDRENILSLGGGYFNQRRALDRGDQILLGGNPPIFLGSQYQEIIRSKGWEVVGDYAVGLDRFELQIGGEYSSLHFHQRLDQVLTLPPIPSQSTSQELGFELNDYRAYADLRFTPSDMLTLEAQAALAGAQAAGTTKDRLDFSLGAALAPAEGHWLRAAIIRSSNLPLPFTLAPTAVVGLRAAEAPTGPDVRAQSIVGRWEAEWSPHVFTSLEAQHQKFDALSFEKPNFVDPIDLAALNGPIGISAVNLGPSQVDRVSASASFWLMGNIGIRTIYAYSHSKVESGPGSGKSVPFLPRHFARGQISWTNDKRIKLTAGLSYVGPRIIALDGSVAPRAWLADTQLSWEPLNKRIKVTAGLFNIFDDKMLLIPGVPNFGRTFTASLDVRL